MSIQVYGMISCVTCRKALQWLDNNNVVYEFIETRYDPPSKEMITYWVQCLTAKPLRNTSGRSYRELGEQRYTWTDEEWIEAFCKNIMLLKRPIFMKDGVPVFVGFRGKKDIIREKLGLGKKEVRLPKKGKRGS